MTLKRFEQLLQKVRPELRIRQRNYGDVGGIFVGMSGKGGYLVRVSKGELNLHGYRLATVNPEGRGSVRQGPIQKRGRRTILDLLRDRRWFTYTQAVQIKWGIDPTV